MKKVIPAKRLSSDKLKFERYTKGKKLKPGKWIGFINSKGDARLLATNQLIMQPVAAAFSFSGIGRTLQEVFNLHYGSGIPQKGPGRFFFRESQNYYSEFPNGWLLLKNPDYDEFLEVSIYLGAYGGESPFPAINFTTIEVNLLCTLSSILTVNINGSVMTYEFDDIGETKLMFNIQKPANSNYVTIRFSILASNNAASNGIWISGINRYSSLAIPTGELDNLEE